MGKEKEKVRDDISRVFANDDGDAATACLGP